MTAKFPKRRKSKPTSATRRSRPGRQVPVPPTPSASSEKSPSGGVAIGGRRRAGWRRALDRHEVGDIGVSRPGGKADIADIEWIKESG
ncbi:hypothetical protein, partial [Micromonospora sp. CV4]|uniref:hypothetical protein n=1 Tax=Micromonospora sp. CV4 TaxID=2478711 RepID=UPI001F41E2E5